MVRDPYLEDRQLAAPKEIEDLVKRFEDYQHIYKSKTYNETELRNHFINPFFEALGWDVQGKNCAPDRQEVKEEGVFKLDDKSEKPDYSFLLLDTDRQIDALVYELYRLTEEEIRIVEGEMSSR